MTKESVAVVGGGVAGIVSSYLLQKKFNVSIYEANDYLGGHTNTIAIPDGKDEGLGVDTGFIVLNDKNYPLMHSFLQQLGVPFRGSEMSFSFTCAETDFFYAGTSALGMFAQRSNLFNKRMWTLLFEIKQFCQNGLRDLEQQDLGSVSLGDYLTEKGYSSVLSQDYLLPMGGAIWSASDDDILRFPVQSFLRFFKNHGLLSFKDRPRWQTVRGGSQSYVRRFLETFEGDIELNCPVKKVRRTEGKPEIVFSDGRIAAFDKVVVATHADQAYRLIESPTPLEKELLSRWSYSNNHTVLHRDISFMPPVRRAWASWNYRREKGQVGSEPVSVTYYMNRLQGLRSHHDYCVTLNAKREISPSEIIKEISYTHPEYSFESVATQDRLPLLNESSDILYCGSYFGYGFHEDAIRAANELGKKFGLEL
jgi:predicted NAD/FAD-binding protein